uniref:PUM-HD domain-containing protein n=1 Tax=Fagus sylvatica TaxID=28930 RepID=A0A2N9J1H0_FAGSY
MERNHRDGSSGEAASFGCLRTWMERKANFHDCLSFLDSASTIAMGMDNNPALYWGSVADLPNGSVERGLYNDFGVGVWGSCSTLQNEFGHLGSDTRNNGCDVFVAENLNGFLRQREFKMEEPNRPRRNGFSLDACGLVGGLACKNSKNIPPRLHDSLSSWTVNDLRGKIMYLARDQEWSRYLLWRMELCTDEEKDVFFKELIDDVDKLMQHPFGNHVVQKLVEICNEQQRTQILELVTKTESQLVLMCLNSIGPGTRALSKNLNGQHVIQHCLARFSDEDNRLACTLSIGEQYLLNEVANNCFEIATDRSGCCVLQECVRYSQGELRERLVAGIIANAIFLAEDQFGNYVVQHLLELKIPRFTENILRKFGGNYLILSLNKYGSNVVEKCLVESGEEHSATIIFELLSSPKCSMLLYDPYGNYVFQSALSVAKGQILKALLNLVRSNYGMMRSNTYGQKVLHWCLKRKLIIKNVPV